MTTPDPLTDIARDLWDACPDVTDYPPGTVVVRQMPDGATEVVVYPQGTTDADDPTITEGEPVTSWNDATATSPHGSGDA